MDFLFCYFQSNSATLQSLSAYNLLVFNYDGCVQKYDGFPLGSMVLYATDDTGRPILAISSLSPHTKVDSDLHAFGDVHSR